MGVLDFTGILNRVQSCNAFIAADDAVLNPHGGKRRDTLVAPVANRGVFLFHGFLLIQQCLAIFAKGLTMP